MLMTAAGGIADHILERASEADLRRPSELARGVRCVHLERAREALHPLALTGQKRKYRLESQCGNADESLAGRLSVAHPRHEVARRDALFVRAK